MKHLHTKLAAVLTAGALVGMGTAEAGSSNFSTVADNITESATKLPDLISTVAYIGGCGLGVAGVFKLKNHVDNPGQTPMKDGLVRLGAGGGLLALPFLTQAMSNSIQGDGSEAIDPTKVQIKPLQFN